MVRRENIVSKIAGINRYRTELKRFQAMSFSDISADLDRMLALERLLYLVAQATIDLAEMLVKLKSYGKPETMSEAFDLLVQAKYINSDLGGSLVKIVGFRNILSHGYDKIERAVIESVLNKHLHEIDEFLALVLERENIEK
jgi:uncharacterized protein YutE (UPF0331/DUF86 family)